MRCLLLIYWLLGVYYFSITNAQKEGLDAYVENIVDGEGNYNRCSFGVFGIDSATGKGLFDIVRTKIVNLEGSYDNPKEEHLHKIRYKSAQEFFEVFETGKVNLSSGPADKREINEYSYLSQLKQSCIVVEDREIESRGQFRVVDPFQFECVKMKKGGVLRDTCMCAYEYGMIDPGVQQYKLNYLTKRTTNGSEVGYPIAEDDSNPKKPGDVVLAYYMRTAMMDRKLVWDKEKQKCLSGKKGHCTLDEENTLRIKEGRPIVECATGLLCQKTLDVPVRSNGHLIGDTIKPIYFGACSDSHPDHKPPESGQNSTSFYFHRLMLWIASAISTSCYYWMIVL